MIVLLFAAATALVLIAAPWRSSAQRPPIVHWFLLVLAPLLQLPALAGSPFQLWPLLGTSVILIWVACNLHLRGAPLLLIGIGVNGLAMLSHGGWMPLDPRAANELGIAAPVGTIVEGNKSVIGVESVWLWIGDWMIVPLPSGLIAASPGDLCIVAAAVYWAVMCRLAGDRPSAPSQARPPYAWPTRREIESVYYPAQQRPTPYHQSLSVSSLLQTRRTL